MCYLENVLVVDTAVAIYFSFLFISPFFSYNSSTLISGSKNSESTETNHFLQRNRQKTKQVVLNASKNKKATKCKKD